MLLSGWSLQGPHPIFLLHLWQLTQQAIPLPCPPPSLVTFTTGFCCLRHHRPNQASPHRFFVLVIATPPLHPPTPSSAVAPPNLLPPATASLTYLFWLVTATTRNSPLPPPPAPPSLKIVFHLLPLVVATIARLSVGSTLDFRHPWANAASPCWSPEHPRLAFLLHLWQLPPLSPLLPVAAGVTMFLDKLIWLFT